MSAYKVGDLSKVFNSSQGLSKSPASKNGDKKNKKNLFGAAKRMKDKETKQGDDSIDEAIGKANKMKEKIAKEKQKQNKKSNVSQDSETKTKDSQTPNTDKVIKKKRKQEAIESTIEESSTTEKKVGKKKNKKAKLDDSDENETDSLSVQKGNKKKKKKEKENLGNASGSDSENQSGFDPKGMVHESLLQKGKKRNLEDDDNDEESEDKPVKKKKKNEGDKPVKKKKQKTEEELDQPKKKRIRVKPSVYNEENKRTIFVGNLSLEMSDKKVMKLFKEFGEIESMRRRCIPVKDPDQLKRVAAIKKEFHPERHNSICYIKFKTEEAAKKSLVNNGKLVNDLHLRVDIVFGEIEKDTTRTVFVGNLPFDVEEEAVWAHFEDCGDIENVRVIRDRKTCLGKGFGYVKFEDSSSKFLALKLHDSVFQGKKLRVTKCQYNNTGDKKKKPQSGSGKPKIPFSKKNKLKAAASGGEEGFQGEKAKRPKKKRSKSNIKSSSVIFPTNKAPNTKSFGGISTGGPSTNKHVKFDDGGKSFGGNSNKGKPNTKSFGGISTGGPSTNKHVKFDGSGKKTFNINSNKSVPAYNITAAATKGKHIVFK